MAYTVKELAQLSGVSVRTLHFYDEIGLLKPAYCGDNGYRYYEEEQLLLLQQILFYRELGFELKQIQVIVARSDFDKVTALRAHKAVLLKDKERMQELLETVDKTIDKLTKGSVMENKALFTGFSNEKQAEYEKYLVEKYGAQAEKNIALAKENGAKMSAQEIEAFKKTADDIFAQLLVCLDEKLDPASAVVQDQVRRHYEWIKLSWTPGREEYRLLGQLYLEHPGFKKFYDDVHPEYAQFLADAMAIFAERELS